MNNVPAQRLYYAALALIVLAGLALRLHRFALAGSQADPAAPLTTLPPGLDSDEAFHLLAALRLTRGEVAPFFKIDQGLPAAMIYLTALVFQFTGPVAEGGRLESAAAGLIVLLAVPLLARRLFPESKSAALIAAAQVAFIFWFVNFSRIGLEQMTAAAMITAAIALYWLWQTRGGLPLALAAGVGLGLALYAYPAAYFTPIVVGLCALHARFFSRPAWHPNRREAAAALAAFLLAAAPLTLFFIQSPDWAARRSAQVAGPGSALDLLRTLEAWVWRGDIIVRHNLPGRPLLDPIQSLFVLAGLWVCARRWREAPFALLLIWFGVMLIPAAASDYPQHFGRLSGGVTVAALIAGAGGAAIWQRFPRAITAVLLAGCVAASGLITARDYFVLWPRTPGYLDVFDFAERVQAESVAALPAGTAAYISPSDRGRPMFAFLWGEAARAQSFNGRVCAVFPERAGQETVWLVNTLEESRTGAVLASAYGAALTVEVLFVESGTPIVTRYHLPAGARASVAPASLGRIGDLVEATSIRVGSVSAGASMPVNFQWRVLGTTDENWTVGVYLLDRDAAVRAQDDRQPCDNAYPTSAWRPGAIVDEDRTLQLPPDLTPGSYTLAVAFYRLSDGLRLEAQAPDGPAGSLLPVAAIAIP
jgi:hypothetical protein